MQRLDKRLRALEERARRTNDDDVLLIVFREEDITEAQRRVSVRSGVPIIILDR
jgi:hypothetical protein